ncbi:MAG: hypothetical protein AAFX58_01190 [Pseudomonadota bacterium]
MKITAGVDMTVANRVSSLLAGIVLAVYLSGSTSSVTRLANAHRAIAARLARSPLLAACRRGDGTAG